MKKIILVALLSVISPFVHAASVNVIGYVECEPMVKEIEFMDRPNHCSNNTKDAQINLILSDSNIIDLKKDSFVVSSLMFKKRDIRMSKYGVENYKQGSFPKVGKNNQFAIFTLEIEPPEFPSVQAITGAGEVSYYTGIEKKTITKMIDVSKPYSFKIGDNVITNMRQDDYDESGSLKAVLSEGFKSLLMGDSDHYLNITSYGSRAQIANIEAFDDGKKLNGEGSSWNDEHKQFNFSKPVGKMIEIKVEYWEGFQEKKIQFSF